MENPTTTLPHKINRQRRKQPTSLLQAIKRRRLGQIDDSTFHVALLTSLVPRNIFLDIQVVPDVNIRRFSPCGKYLITMKHNATGGIVYRFETGGRRQISFPTLSTSTHANIPSDHDIDFTLPAISDTDLLAPSTPSLSQFSPNLFSNPLNQHHQSVHKFSTLPANRTLPLRRAPRGLLEHISLPLPPQFENNNPRQQQQQQQQQQHHPPRCHFNRFFTQLYHFSIDQPQDDFNPNFCLVTHSSRYMLLLSVYHQIISNDESRQDPNNDERHAVRTSVYYERITFHLVELETGQTKDRYHIYNDNVHFHDHSGVHLYENSICILAIRHQALHILSVQEHSGRLLLERILGASCESDDDLEIARVRTEEEKFQIRRRESSDNAQSNSTMQQKTLPFNAPTLKRRRSIRDSDDDQNVRLRRSYRRLMADVGFSNPNGSNRVANSTSMETGLGNGRIRLGFITGLMHRLLVFVHRKMENENRIQNFFRVVDQFSSLLMQKVQFLDNDHLLIKLGSNSEGRGSAPAGTCFFIIYCISETTIEELFDNQSPKIFEMFDPNRGLCIMSEAEAAMFPPIRNPNAQQDTQANFSSNSTFRPTSSRGRNQMISRAFEALFELPVSCQVKNTSPYLDRRVFSYSTQKQSALYGSRAHPLRSSCFKFSSVYSEKILFRLGPSAVRQRLLRHDHNTGPRSQIWSQEEMKITKTKTRFLFHPILPFVITIETDRGPHQILSFNVYGHEKPRDQGLIAE